VGQCAQGAEPRADCQRLSFGRGSGSAPERKTVRSGGSHGRGQTRAQRPGDPPTGRGKSLGIGGFPSRIPPAAGGRGTRPVPAPRPGFVRESGGAWIPQPDTTGSGRRRGPADCGRQSPHGRPPANKQVGPRRRISWSGRNPKTGDGGPAAPAARSLLFMGRSLPAAPRSPPRRSGHGPSSRRPPAARLRGLEARSPSGLGTD